MRCGVYNGYVSGKVDSRRPARRAARGIVCATAQRAQPGVIGVYEKP